MKNPAAYSKIPQMLPIILVAMLSGCGTTLFHADFEADTVGSLPAERPPTAPSGDLIYTTDPRALSVIDSDALSSKSLRFVNVDIPVSFVGFISRPVSLAPNNVFYAMWRGSINLDPTGSGLVMWLGNGNFSPVAGIRFKNGDIAVQTPPPDGVWETIGSYSETTPHVVLIKVDGQTQTYTISFLQRGRRTITAGPHAANFSEALRTTRPTLYMNFYERTSGPGSYVVDNVLITQDEPEME